MLKNLKKGDYPTKRMFQDDLDLIWANCLEYNSAESHPLRACALRLKRKADRLLASITDIRDRQNPDLDAVFPHSPSSGVKSKLMMNGHVAPVVARTRTRTPTVVPRSVTTVVGKRADTKDSLSYDAWIASPALTRSAEGMAHVRALEQLVDASDSSPEARARAVEALRDYIPASSAHLLESRSLQSLHSPMDVDSDSGQVGEKRKAPASRLSPERPMKRQRTDSPDIATGSTTPDPLELWWAAQSSDLFLGNAMPPQHLRADSKPFPRPTPFPPQAVASALPPLPTASTSASAAAAASLPTPAASHGTPTSSATAAPAQLAGKKRKRARPRAVPPPRETSLLARMNNNINSIRRVRAAHARFSQIVEAGEDDANGPGGGGAIGGGGAGIDAPMEVEGGCWTLPGGTDGAHGVDVGSRAAEQCMRWASSKVLEHVGFEGTSNAALDTLGSVMGEYLGNLGRTMRFYEDKYCGAMSGEEIILHALFEGGVRETADLDGYIREDVLRHGTRLAELEKKVHSAFGELGGTDALDDAALFGEDGEEGEEEDGAYVMGDTFDELGEDFLGFRELGIASEFNLQTNRIPAKLLKRRRAAKDAEKDKKDGPPPLPYPLPPPFEPLATEEIDEQIGLLRDFYREKLDRLMGPPPPAPGDILMLQPQLQPQPNTTIPGVLPPIPGVLPPPPTHIPGVSFPTGPIAIPPPAFVPDDPIPTARSKVGPLGQIVSAKPPTAKKAKADARKAEEAAAKAAAAASNANAGPGLNPLLAGDKMRRDYASSGGDVGKEAVVVVDGKDGVGKGGGGEKPGEEGKGEKDKEKPAPKKKKAPVQDNGLPKKRGRPPKNTTVAHSPVVAASA